MTSLSSISRRLFAAIGSLAISALVLSVTFIPVTQDVAHSGIFA